MRLSETERGPHSRIREVSDLRTQYQCEYRLHLKQKLGGSSSKASVMGSTLHSKISDQSRNQPVEKGVRLLPIMIFILTLIAGLMWIMW
ncbi:MAG: hypothetical protein ACW98U_01600 [Candidatus Thorarchaeota archaeon]